VDGDGDGRLPLFAHAEADGSGRNVNLISAGRRTAPSCGSPAGGAWKIHRPRRHSRAYRAGVCSGDMPAPWRRCTAGDGLCWNIVNDKRRSVYRAKEKRGRRRLFRWREDAAILPKKVRDACVGTAAMTQLDHGAFLYLRQISAFRLLHFRNAALAFAWRRICARWRSSRWRACAHA